MKIIERYTPPSPGALARLKTELGYNSRQMAELSGLASGEQWRKYTGGAKPRVLSEQTHFLLAARLTLSESEYARVLETMRAQGAQIDEHSFSQGEHARSDV